jgi:hypothetical protein
MLQQKMYNIILTLILIVVIIMLVAGLAPSVILAFGNLAVVPNLYFASFYGTGGVANIVFGAAILLLIIGLVLLLVKGKGGSK